MSNVLIEKNELDMEIALGAIAAFPTFEEASDFLKTEHGKMVSPAKLQVVANRFRDKLEKTREKIAPQIEAMAANNMLDLASLSTQVQLVALQRAKEQLEDGRVGDPTKMARDIADVMAKNVDKRLALQGRPTQITETRNTDEILRALEGMGVVKQIEAEVVE